MARLLAVALLVTGCSVISVRDARTTPTKAIVCESSWITPVVDTALAVTGAVLVAWSATDGDSGETDGHALTKREAAKYPGLVLAVPFAFSAVYGCAKVSACKAAATSEK